LPKNQSEEEHKELLAMVEKLKRTNQSLEKMAFLCAHDLKAPLRNIAGLTQLLAEHNREALDPMSREYIDVIKRSVEVMQTILMSNIDENLLQRPAATAHQLVPLSGVVSDVKAVLMRLILERNVHVIVKKLPIVYGDKAKLIQLFQNLVQNAIKYSYNVPPTIRIQAVELPEHWQISVQDNGMGISKENQSHIFELFSRAKEHSHMEGAGIGLAICSKIAAEHHGKIWLESEVGKGTCFYVTLAKRAT
jgi:light-regulated signal transduction histidine kinase (bacteriophytochrome)